MSEQPDAWAGVSPEYQNYANETEKPLAAPGDEVVLPETPDVPITVNPDGTPAGVYALFADSGEEEVADDAASEDEDEDASDDAADDDADQ